MAIAILPTLSEKLSDAHQVLETLVLRTHDGVVFSIAVGRSLLENQEDVVGAKITQESQPRQHIGVCVGKTVGEVTTAAQEIIATNLLERSLPSESSAVPKPHINASPRVSA